MRRITAVTVFVAVSAFWDSFSFYSSQFSGIDTFIVKSAHAGFMRQDQARTLQYNLSTALERQALLYF